VLGHDVQRKYDDFMRGCAERYSKRECENTERVRAAPHAAAFPPSPNPAPPRPAPPRPAPPTSR
jgi:hypothetical protein